MKTVVGMATIPGREQYVRRAIDSLYSQVDEIYLYDNGKLPDLSDNAKFFGLSMITEPCFYLSCDDDLIYPPDYANYMMASAKRFNSIVTLHGRRLRGVGMNYYRDHQAFRFNQNVPQDQFIDVAGTGVTAFFTDYFKPDISQAEDKCMSDLVFSLEAKKQGKHIVLLQHGAGYVIDQMVPETNTIRGQYASRCERQSQLADEIYNLKHGRK